jgi:hypothetical protein
LDQGAQNAKSGVDVAGVKYVSNTFVDQQSERLTRSQTLFCARPTSDSNRTVTRFDLRALIVHVTFFSLFAAKPHFDLVSLTFSIVRLVLVACTLTMHASLLVFALPLLFVCIPSTDAYESRSVNITIRNMRYDVIMVHSFLEWGKWWFKEKNKNYDLDPFMLLPGESKEFGACGRWLSPSGTQGYIRIMSAEMHAWLYTMYFGISVGNNRYGYWQFHHPTKASIGTNNWELHPDMEDWIINVYSEEVE